MSEDLTRKTRLAGDSERIIQDPERLPQATILALHALKTQTPCASFVAWTIFGGMLFANPAKSPTHVWV